MAPNNCLFILLLSFLLFLFSEAQTLPISSYSLLSDYTSNPYFQVVNQTLYRAYPSYLSQTTITSVYLHSSQNLVSIIVTYINNAGTSYRGTANYIPSTRQLSVQSFGPVVSIQNAGAMVAPAPMTVYGEENGIGITAANSPPNRTSSLISGPNPTIRNQQISVLLPNSTSTRSTSTGSNTNSNSSISGSNSDSRDSYASSSTYSSRSRSFRD